MGRSTRPELADFHYATYSKGRENMQDRARIYARLARLAAASVSAMVLGAPAFAASYSLTVSKDRLTNAHFESQNWLLMNGDYASTRYSRLTQINRDNVKDLRLVWAKAPRGLRDGVGDAAQNDA